SPLDSRSSLDTRSLLDKRRTACQRNISVCRRGPRDQTRGFLQNLASGHAPWTWSRTNVTDCLRLVCGRQPQSKYLLHELLDALGFRNGSKSCDDPSRRVVMHNPPLLVSRGAYRRSKTIGCVFHSDFRNRGTVVPIMDLHCDKGIFLWQKRPEV